MEDKAEEGRPELPRGWSWIEDLQGKLDLGQHGEELADLAEGGGNVEDAIWEVADGNVDFYDEDLTKWLAEIPAPAARQWYREAVYTETLRAGSDDLFNEIKAMQFECLRSDMREHLGDTLEYVAYEHVKEAYVAAAISDGLAGRIGEIDLSDVIVPWKGDDFENLKNLVDEAVGASRASLGGRSVPGFMTKEEASRAGKEAPRFEAYEDNAGGLYLAALDQEGKAVWLGSGYDSLMGFLAADALALRHGADPIGEGWEGVEDPQALYDEIREASGKANGPRLVTDQDGTYPEAMGRNAIDEFENEEPSLDAEARDAREASAELGGGPSGGRGQKER